MLSVTKDAVDHFIASWNHHRVPQSVTKILRLAPPPPLFNVNNLVANKETVENLMGIDVT